MKLYVLKSVFYWKVLSIVLQSERGQRVIDVYNRRETDGIDDDIWRELLIKSIVEYYTTKNQCMKAKDFTTIVDKITEKFPGEIKVRICACIIS